MRPSLARFRQLLAGFSYAWAMSSDSGPISARCAWRSSRIGRFRPSSARVRPILAHVRQLFDTFGRDSASSANSGTRFGCVFLRPCCVASVSPARRCPHRGARCVRFVFAPPSHPAACVPLWGAAVPGSRFARRRRRSLAKAGGAPSALSSHSSPLPRRAGAAGFSTRVLAPREVFTRGPRWRGRVWAEPRIQGRVRNRSGVDEGPA